LNQTRKLILKLDFKKNIILTGNRQ
jgi:hypothetical protein